MENIDNATHVSPITQPRIRGRPIAAIWAFLRAAIRAARTRRELVLMDERLWSDIGISRGEALMESSRKVWDLTSPVDPTRRRRGE
ncbi:MAG TPA: DUF1127 domain-containing protein [Acidisoma sp.]|jgi:uncharacterized protein YjiS (DUF1127 family)|nr:DUF1127 domain-containing protein [Acidisoma sp.]